MDKLALRKSLLDKLSSLTSEQLHTLSFSLTKQIIKFFHTYPDLTGLVGAGYLPLKAEIAPVYQELFKEVPLNLTYPVLVEAQMQFALPQGMPRGATWLDAPYVLADPSWLLIPGVGFDLNGSRLGRGKGFYDRYLHDRDVLKIGLAWSEQIVEQIPVESHDSDMDFIITEEYCWDVNRQIRF